MTRQTALGVIVLAALSPLSCIQATQPPHGTRSAAPQPLLDWKKLEAPLLTGHIQLTSRDAFLKAGEAYFSPDASWIIFQAVPPPKPDSAPDPFYSMYVAKVARDGSGDITGLGDPILISPPESANTCGWFHPTVPGRVIFGSTITKPNTDQKSGFQVGGRTYIWLFPEETEITSIDIPPILGAPMPSPLPAPTPVFSRPDYDAECSYSADGRFILYAHVRENSKTAGRADADLWIYDTQTRRQHAIVTADGYDGGPFFSPDGKRICYRSDRKLNDLLQVFIADLKFDADGVPVGIEREYQVTNNKAVNWAPFFHPSGKFLVYGSSEVSHQNYEVIAVELDEAVLRADSPSTPAAAALRHARITQANGADILPVFTPDGKWMMWTAQRGAMLPSEQKPSSQLWAAKFDPSAMKWVAEVR